MVKDKILLHSVSKNKDGETFDVRWSGLLVGTVVVPYNTAAVLDFKTKSGVNTYYIQRAALKLYNEYKRDINVQMARKSFTVNAASFEHKKTKQNNPDVEWRKYYDLVNKYMGKYREYKCGNKIGVELILKKNIKTTDALLVVSAFLKKYPVIKFSISQNQQQPVDINNAMSRIEIENVIVCVLTGQDIKQKKHSDSKKQTTLTSQQDVEQTETNDDVVPKSMEPSHDIDPMLLAKVLTLVCSPKQTIDNAKKAAQQKANEQYTCVKLLDKDSKFVCNIYPTITAKEHALQRGGRIRDAIYRNLNDREIGD